VSRPPGKLVVALGAALTLALGTAFADCECDPRPLDVVVVIDSTGSMTGALDAVKRKIQRVLELLRENAPHVRVGIVTYRDVGDEYLRRGLELTTDFPKVVSYLNGIQANGGGDTPEAVEAGLDMAYSDAEMRWDPRAKKIALLVGDAPPHDKDKQLCDNLASSARAKGIVTFTLSVEGTIQAFKDIATAGGGKNVDIAKSDDIARQVLALTLDRDEHDFDNAFAPAPGGSQGPRSTRTEPRPEGAFVFQQLRHEGDWDPPHASRRLLRALRERAGIDCAAERHVIRAQDDSLLHEPFVYLTGHGELKLTAEEEARLHLFLERGGTLLIERCCDGEAFDTSARALARRLTGKELAPVGPDHPVFRSGGAIGELEHTIVHGGHDYVKRRPVLLEIKDARGRPSVLYSPIDLGCGWSGLEAGKSCALRERDALRWTVNIILYVLST
jgi:uncharacterized protein YegL